MGKKPIKTLAEKEGISVDVENNGLRLAWVKFVDAYVENGGNATQAYLKAYPESSSQSARAHAPRLVAKGSIRDEINNRLETQKVTDDFIIAGLADIAVSFRATKTIMAAVKALEVLARIRGMLTDTKKFAFTAENPCIFPSLIKPENAKKFEQEEKLGIRITE